MLSQVGLPAERLLAPDLETVVVHLSVEAGLVLGRDAGPVVAWHNLLELWYLKVFMYRVISDMYIRFVKWLG